MSLEAGKHLQLLSRLFKNRGSLLNYWQMVAENFYPQLADFTTTRTAGEEFASHLTTSYPLLAAGELANTLGSMLRPKDRDWFLLKPQRPERVDKEGNMWLEWARDTQRRAMLDRVAQFTRATKQGDADYVNFGQCVISTEINRNRTAFLYRNWHLRDCAWMEGYDGQISHFGRKWNATAADLVSIFRDKVHKNVSDAIRLNEPFKEFKCAHLVIPNEEKTKHPYRSIFIDCEGQHIMEDVPSWTRIYTIPRWQTISGSPYAYSPSVVAALPDARLIQAISLTLLDAGEMYAAPPMLAVYNAIRGDIDLRSRGITWVDNEYDERLGEALRPLSQDARGYPIAENVREEARTMIASAFFLNKLTLPQPTSAEMTAYEVAQRVQEFIRTTLPLFEPIEDEYNGALCDITFDIGLRNGLFGPLDRIPESLRKQQIEFKFVSPISQAREKEKGIQFMESKNLLLEAAQLDPGLAGLMDAETALRDALSGINTPASWVRDKSEVEALRRKHQQELEQMKQLASAEQLAGTAQKAGAAAKDFNAAQMEMAA